jgi:nucleoside-diphosphate-sugar epimerase
VGSYAKLAQATGWRPEISLRDSIGSVVEYWRDQHEPRR